MAILCERYWNPLYVFVRRKGYGPEDTEDAVQGFFALLIEHDWLERADESKGKLRTFFLTLLDRHLAGEWRKANALKRGGGNPTVSFDRCQAEDWYGAEPLENLTPEAIYDKRWALSVLEQTLMEMENHYKEEKQPERFAAMKPFLGWNNDEQSQGEAARGLGMSAGAFKVAIHRMRKRYRDQLHQTVAHTLQTADKEEIKSEIQHLFAALG